jgi:shikimate kinase
LISKLHIIGFMGSGKSTLASLAAQHWDLPCYDSDQLLSLDLKIDAGEQLAGNPGAFRQREAQVAAQLIQLDKGVVALGGGAIENRTTMAHLQGKPVLLLDPGVDICWQRVRSHSQHRPLATDYHAFVALYNKRLPMYTSVCRWQLSDNLPPDMLLQKLESIIQLDITPRN